MGHMSFSQSSAAFLAAACDPPWAAALKDLVLPGPPAAFLQSHWDRVPSQVRVHPPALQSGPEVPALAADPGFRLPFDLGAARVRLACFEHLALAVGAGSSSARTAARIALMSRLRHGGGEASAACCRSRARSAAPAASSPGCSSYKTVLASTSRGGGGARPLVSAGASKLRKLGRPNESVEMSESLADKCRAAGRWGVSESGSGATHSRNNSNSRICAGDKPAVACCQRTVSFKRRA